MRGATDTLAHRIGVLEQIAVRQAEPGGAYQKISSQSANSHQRRIRFAAAVGASQNPAMS
jgi:hypothetical protein